MAKQNIYQQSWNSGVQDSTALPRTDLERMRLAAEIQTNIMCRATGPGFFRPGTQYLHGSAGNLTNRLYAFVFGVADAALLELGDQTMRVTLNDQVISRVAVSSTVTSGDFSSATGWDLTSTNGASSIISGGFLQLNALAVNSQAMAAQAVTTASAGTEHALRINVARGPVNFRCGSTAGGQDYIEDTVLNTGTHSLALTPTGTFYVRFASSGNVVRYVDSIQIESAGIMSIPTPWAATDLYSIRIAQSADVLFCACDGYQQKRIERRGSRSWSVATYQSDDGPMQAPDTTGTRIAPSFVNGNVVLTANDNIFSADQVESIIRLDHSGQLVQNNLSSEDSYTDAVRITGVGSDRTFSYTINGTWSGTLTMQRSADSATDGFSDVSTTTINKTDTYEDNDDNAIYWFRWGFKPGNFTSGTAIIRITYAGGSGYGRARITNYLTPTTVNAEVLKAFLGISYTKDWELGRWSAKQGWPSAVTLSDGRLWWSGQDKVDGSVSDAFASFDEETEGDSGPISRSIATGGVNDTKWMMSLQRLLIGTEGTINTVKSSSLDEPLTPTNFGIKDSSNTGASAVDPAKIDARGIFVERAGTALMELAFDGSNNDYNASQISKLTTEIFSSGIKTLAVQRRPDTRIWLVLNDGSCVCMVYEPNQEVLAFIPIATSGSFVSVAVLPSLVQDRVYFTISRIINGSTVFYVEKMAMDSEVKPSTLCKTMDAFNTGTNSPASATVNVGTHLIGATVVAWADGAPIEISAGVPATFTVSNTGTITLPSAVTNWVVGLPYRGRYKSARLSYGAQGGTAMLQKKNVDNLGLIITDFVRAGLKYGGDFDNPYRPLYNLPQQVDGEIQPAIVLSDIRDEEQFPFPGEWDTDSRICLEINSPYCALLLGMVYGITTNER